MPGPPKGVPRSPTPRPYVGVRLGPALLVQIDALAVQIDRQRSETIRLLLGHALATPAVLRAVKADLE